MNRFGLFYLRLFLALFIFAGVTTTVEAMMLSASVANDINPVNSIVAKEGCYLVCCNPAVNDYSEETFKIAENHDNGSSITAKKIITDKGVLRSPVFNDTGLLTIVAPGNFLSSNLPA